MSGELNLAPVRGPSVWGQPGTAGNERQGRRWTAVAGGVGLMAAGVAVSLVGWRLLKQAAARASAAGQRPGLPQQPDTADDIVTRESAHSFPASDAPSWTPVAGAR